MEKINFSDLVFVRAGTVNSEKGVFSDGSAFIKINPDDSMLPGGVQDYLFERGFPVSKIIDRGIIEDEKGGEYYYCREENAGTPFSECDNQRRTESYADYVLAVGSWLEHQMRTPFAEGEECPTIPDLYHEHDIEPLKADLVNIFGPSEAEDLYDKLQEAWQRLLSSINDLPQVINHGDLVARNITVHGKVFDLENAFIGPMGYDGATALFHDLMFPPASVNAEASRSYGLESLQIKAGLEMLDAMFTNYDLRPLTEFVDDFILLRLIKACIDEGDRPRLQSWRFNLLKQATEAYTTGSITLSELLFNYENA